MEVLEGLLLFLGILIGLPLIVLLVTGWENNTLKKDFSKKGLEKHAKEYFGGLLLWSVVFLVIGFFKRKP